MKYISICSGIEAATVAFHPLGWTPLAFAEIEAFPSAVLAYHYPSVPNLGDMTRYEAWPENMLAECDLIVGGPPCFAAGTLVLTETGYLPIEDIQPGDRVITHHGRLRNVLRVGSKDGQPVGILRGIGRREGLYCTPKHPFLEIPFRSQCTKRHNRYALIAHFGDRRWTPAESMPGRQWCALTSYANNDTIPESTKFDAKTAMYMAGMYLGDGWIRKHKLSNKKEIILGINPAKYEKLRSVLGKRTPPAIKTRTGVRVVFGDTKFADWLILNFGQLSHAKNLPAWVLGHPFRQELLRGYLDTDGYVTKKGMVRISCTSRRLSYGIAALLETQNHTASVGKVVTPDTRVIEGRTVNQRDWYQIHAWPMSCVRKARLHEGYLMRKVLEFSPQGEQRVYNLEVDEDNSYVAEGAVVHNCQAFSIAGLRGGLDDARGQLTLTYVKLINHIDRIRLNHGRDPVVIIYENVPGIYTAPGNPFGCLVGALCGQDAPLETETGKWPKTGVFWGAERRVGYRTLDAQYFGLAQRRRRCFLIAVPNELIERFGNRADPAEILAIPESLRGDSPPRREAGESATATLAARTQGGGCLGTDFECAGGLQAFGGGNVGGAVNVSAALTTKDRSDFETETFVVGGVR